jgi:transcriptional regulator NrdR family protein
MKCPECGDKTEVLETRKNKQNTYRRYQCVNKHRFTTYERVSLPKVSVREEQTFANASSIFALPALRQ